MLSFRRLIPNTPIGAKVISPYLIALFILVLLPNCAIFYKPPPPKPLDDKEAAAIISRFSEQDRKVFSFYSHGILFVKDWKGETELNFLIIGTKNPFKIKIEITHTWGQPIFHILISKNKLEALSLPEKKIYLGDFTPEALSRFFPGNFTPTLIWAALRAHPVLLTYDKILTFKANQISLFNEEEKEVEIIDFYAESLFPRLVTYPEQNINVAFSDFQEIEGIFYAGNVKVDKINGGGNLIFKNRKMVFNRAIPAQIFILKKPPGFETHYLDENPNDAN